MARALHVQDRHWNGTLTALPELALQPLAREAGEAKGDYRIGSAARK